MLEHFRGTLHFPCVIMGKVIVGRDGDRDASPLGGPEHTDQVGHEVLLRHAISYDTPAATFGAHEVDLRINNHESGSWQVHPKSGLRPSRFSGTCLMGRAIGP